jgi:carboxyl-terminal processing protease
MKKFKKNTLILLLIMLQLVFVIPLNAADYSDYLDKVIDLVNERYYQDVPEEELIEGALRGIFDTMDDYTTFFDMDEAASFMSSMEGNYQGIGVEITQVPEGVLVTRVFSNSPAESAGIQPNDRIVQVEKADVKGFTATDVAALIRGENGTYVEVGIIRGNSMEIIYINVQRSVVNISPVTWKQEGDIMYIKLESFSSNSSLYFKKALKDMDDLGLRKMVLDLRNNPGGEVSQAVSIARLLVHKGIITTLDFKSEETSDVVYQSYMTRAKYIPAVLVNGNSASASEILASAIQDSQDGFLIGTKTFGKGVVQNLYPILSPRAYERYKILYGEGIIDGYDWINKHGVNILDSDLIGWTKITTGHYLTRSGKMIDSIGITPDFVVENYELVKGIDIQSIKTLESTVDITVNGIANDVYNAEKVLTVMGYALDAPDNILDNKTSDALKKYQTNKGINSTGIIDSNTREFINKDIKTLQLSIDKQYAKAIELLGLFNH